MTIYKQVKCMQCGELLSCIRRNSEYLFEIHKDDRFRICNKNEDCICLTCFISTGIWDSYAEMFESVERYLIAGCWSDRSYSEINSIWVARLI